MTNLNAPQCDKNLRIAIVKHLGFDYRAAKSKVRLIDLMVAYGWKSTDCMSPKSADSTATVDGYAWLNDSIVASFNASAKKLLAAPTTKGMSEADAKDRRYWHQQIGAKRSDFRAALLKRETADAEPNAAGTGKRSFYAIVDDQLATWAKRVERDAAELPGLDVDAFKKELTKLQGMVRKANKVKA